MDRRSSLGIGIKLVYLLIYLLPLVGSLLFLIFDYRDREIRLHALQCLFVAIAVGLVHVVLGFLAAIPFIGAFFVVVIWAMYILYALVMLFGMFRALVDAILPIPFFYDLAYRGSYR
ncbi:MAG: hypothetical protein IJP03_03045 [Christensenellaceae bacterium]|nr:hypothetical protein [Christensenellaceae bacterium]